LAFTQVNSMGLSVPTKDRPESFLCIKARNRHSGQGKFR
jgi:hypothetical protein